MYRSTRFLYSLALSFLIFLLNVPLFAQNSDTLFYDSFENMDNWTPVGPQGMTSWEMSNTNYAGGIAAPEIRFTWVYPFVGASYLISPVFYGMQGHNMELKFNYYEDYWSNIVYVGVAVTGDGGNNYNSIWELQASGDSGPEQITVDFSGIDNMQLALYYLGDSNDIDFWYVDDFTLLDLDAVPVELTSFTAQVVNGSVTLNWVTATETNNKGFEVERSQELYVKNSNWEIIGFIDGNGTTTQPSSYSFTDNNANQRTYSYRLKQINFDGTYEFSKIVEAVLTTPAEYALKQNYPNPFNPSTQINFSIPVNAGVKLAVYNILGQNVIQLVNRDFPAGNHLINFNASNLSSGLYFYVLEANGADGTVFRSTRKMMLTK